ncbi:unnamed protein product, partial [Ectocarpus sp. 12 AP-2014]
MTTTSIVRRGCGAYRSGAGIDCCGGHETSRLPEARAPTHPRPRLLHSVIGKARDAAGGTRATATLRPGKTYTATPQPPPDGYSTCNGRATVPSARFRCFKSAGSVAPCSSHGTGWPNNRSTRFSGTTCRSKSLHPPQ